MGSGPGSNYWEWITAEQEERARKAQAAPARKEVTRLPSGLWGPREFAAMTDEQLHEVKMGSEPGSNYWEWANAEQQERQRNARAAPPEPGSSDASRATATVAQPEERQWDIFICHATEDKEEIARPLAEALGARNLAVWFDERSLTVGDSLRRSIDEGLANSKFGIVILSPRFFEKHWPQQELNGLAAKEVGGAKVILPVLAQSRPE